MTRVLCVGDIHEPATHPLYRAFCLDLYERYNCDRVHLIGDVVDFHATSFHAAVPECDGPDAEFEAAYAQVQKWYSIFPKATVSIGNHDARVLRLSSSVNVPARFIRQFSDFLDTPGWTWEQETIIDDVSYSHGEGSSGEHPAYNRVKHSLQSCVIGHVHTAMGVRFKQTPTQLLFGVDTGCGIDAQHPAMAYAAKFPRKSCLGAAVVLDGEPISVPMLCGRGQAYHRSKAAIR